MSTILITGGTGLLGSALKNALEKDGHRVLILTRNFPTERPDYFHWNVEAGFVDPNALNETDVIFHLAGASIAEKRWTPKYKKVLLESRTLTSALIADRLRDFPNRVKTVIATSAIGVYGNTGDQWVDENSTQSSGFLGELCRKWEKELMRFDGIGKRVVILRTGVVLSPKGGMLKEVQKPVKLFVGSAIGSGQQYVSWIHIDDMVRMLIYAMKNESVKGTFNAAAPEPVTNKAFMQSLAHTLHRPLWPFNVPSKLISVMMGEKAEIILEGQRVSSKKIISSGFNFNFTHIDSALHNLLLDRSN